MKWILFLFMIILIKIILTKGMMLAFILLSLWAKGKSIKKSSVEWNDYLLTLNEKFVNKYVIVLYSAATLMSSCAAYILFNVFGFQNPLAGTIILTVICAALSILKYLKKGKKEVVAGLYKIHKSALDEKAGDSV